MNKPCEISIFFIKKIVWSKAFYVLVSHTPLKRETSVYWPKSLQSVWTALDATIYKTNCCLRLQVETICENNKWYGTFGSTALVLSKGQKFQLQRVVPDSQRSHIIYCRTPTVHHAKTTKPPTAYKTRTKHRKRQQTFLPINFHISQYIFRPVTDSSDIQTKQAHTS